MRRDRYRVSPRLAVLCGFAAALGIALTDRWIAAAGPGSTQLGALQLFRVLLFAGATSLWVYFTWQARREDDDQEYAARRQVERLLRESEERLRLAIETAPMGTWDLNLTTGQVYWSANMWELFGLKPDPENLSFELFRSTLHPEDRARVLLAVDTAIKNNTPYNIEFRIVHPSGRIRWALTNGRCIVDDSGKPVRMVGVDLDITERKEAEAVLRTSEQRFRTLAQAVNDAVWDCDLATGRLIWSEGLTTLFGYPVGPATEDVDWWRSRIHPDDKDRVAAILADALRGKAPVWSADYRFLRADGSYADVLSRGQVEHDRNGRARWIMGALIDITPRKRMEEALRESEKRLKLAMTASRMGVWEWNLQTSRIFWSEECFSLMGTSSDDTFDSIARLLHPDDTNRVGEAAQTALITQTSFAAELRVLLPDELIRWVAILGRFEYDEAGAPLRLIGTVMDIHQRKQAEFALEHQRRRMEGIVNSAMDGIITISEDHKIEVFNTAAESMFGYSAEEVLGHDIALLLPLQSEDRYHDYLVRLGQPGETLRAIGRLGTISGCRKGGEKLPIEASISQIQLDGRKLFTVTCRDVSDRIKAATLIQDSQERFGQLAEHIREVFWVRDLASEELLYISPAYEQIWGRSVETLYRSPKAWLETVHPDDSDAIIRAAQAKQATGEFNEIYRILRPDGTQRWIHARTFPIQDAAGQVARVAGIAEDITDRRALEEQLLQSQKLEAIGLLAGGVAHDFNNLLTVIKGNAALMLAPGILPEQTVDGAQEIVKAAERAASLTRQLLQFSRKQTLHLTELQLNEIIGNVLKMLQRILGEDIVLSFEPAPKLPLISADAGMIEQVLLNLAVNARDAMPRGGNLILTTDVETLAARQAQKTLDAAPGVYVCLTVTDSGVGIAKEHLGHIFEPFFTTKEVGKGTGLGLATVYGIVKQHRGRILVSSEINRGTSFRIGIPALTAAASESAVRAAAPAPALPHDRATILVVEDEAAVRRLVASVLTKAGYNVLQATSGVEALTVWERHADRIHLLLTDLIMPDGMNGRELAQHLKTARPELKIIYTSGYSPDWDGSEATLHEGMNFLQKPYQPSTLIGMVRECLERG